jgi:7-carboxy-7-deazaguanine synthase
MVTTLIAAIQELKYEKRISPLDGSMILNVAEHFADTIQGENLVGVPSAFLRLQYCTLACKWCDTLEVWKRGNPYTTKEILDLWGRSGMVEKFRNGQHLILTGGSPLKQQDALIDLIKRFDEKYNFIPIIEIENECVLMPREELIQYIHIWNNSPKLANSGMHERIRYKPEIIKKVSRLPKSYFKFVVQTEDEWNEIKTFFLDTNLIDRDQIVLMPEGQTREELQSHYEAVVNIAVRENVRMTDRFHVTIWNKKTGV